MKLKESIETVNTAIRDCAINETGDYHGIVETMTIDGKTILSDGSDNQVGIDDSYSVIVWHRLISSSNVTSQGRGLLKGTNIFYNMKLICYSKDAYLIGIVMNALANTPYVEIQRSNYNKQQVLQSELPEAQRNFDIDSFFFSVDYTIEANMSKSLNNKLCFNTVGRALNSSGAVINVDENFTSKQYNSAYQTLAFSANIAIDFDQGQACELTLTGDATISNPTNLESITPLLVVTQDGTGGRALTFDTDFNVDVTAVTTQQNSVTIYNFVVHAGTIYGAGKTFLV